MRTLEPGALIVDQLQCMIRVVIEIERLCMIRLPSKLISLKEMTTLENGLFRNQE